MATFGVVIRFDRVVEHAAHLFAYMDGSLVLIVDRQQDFFHAVPLCKLQTEAEDRFAVSFSLFGHPDGITDAADLRQDLFGKLSAELKLADESPIVDRPVVKADRLTFDQSAFLPVIP